MDIDKIIEQRDLCFKMRKAREKYGLSARNMSWILGFGVNQWRLYELGEAIPDQVHLRVINLVFNPYVFYEFLRNPTEDIFNKVSEKRLDASSTLCKSLISEIDQEVNKQSQELKQSLIDKLFK